MARWLCLALALLMLLPAGCGESTPDRREAQVPQEEREYPGLEVNPPDTYRYMHRPDDSDEYPRPLPAD